MAPGAKGPMIKPAEKKPAASEPLSILSDPTLTLTEAYRTARTNLLFMGVDEPYRKIMVTSAVPREGKTTAVANLGMTMAQAGSRVLLVDADMRRPGLHRFFQLGNKVGLTSVLGDQADITQAIQPTKLPGLSLLTAGPSVASPADLLASRRMADLVKRLEEQYDILLFDTPPVITVVDAMVLGGTCDGVILVVRSGAVPHEVVSRAKRQLENARARVLGVLLNAFDFKREAYSYYYYTYAYGYGSANTDGERAK